MRHFWRNNRTWLAVLLSVPAAVGTTEPAFAYLDPGTGSLILQAIIGVFIAVSATAGIYWQKVKSAVTGIFGRSKDKSPDNRRQIS